MADKAVFSNGNNHSFNTAQELHINEIVYGNMTSVNIDDYYKINFSGSGQMQFLLKISDDTRYNMYIYEEGNLTTHIAHMGGDPGNDRSITRLVENKTYYIKIYAYDANSINHNTSGYDYNLQFIPTVATGISINLSRNITFGEEPASFTYAITPVNSYVDIDVYNTGNDININGNIVRAVNHGMDTITVTDNISGISKSTNIMSMPTPVAIPQKDNGYCFASCLQTLDNMWGGTYTQDDPGIRSDGYVLVNNSIVRWTTGGTTCQAIKNAIDGGNYCLVYITGGYPHWVIAYYASSASPEGIKIIDTNHLSNDTLADAMAYHGSETISENRITYKA